MKQLIDLFEKTAATYVQQFIALLVVADMLNASTAEAAAIAAVPAGLTVIANGLPQSAVGLPFYVDLALRTLRTYVVSAIGLLVAAPEFAIDISSFEAAAIGGLPAALAVVKGGLAKRVGDPDTAAMIPRPRRDRPLVADGRLSDPSA